MRTLVLLFVAFALMSFQKKEGYTSNATIEAKKQFVIGGCNCAFTATIENVSKADINVFGRNEAGEKTFSYGMPGKATTEVNVDKGEVLVLQNPSNKKITVRTTTNKQMSLMQYEPLTEGVVSED